MPAPRPTRANAFVLWIIAGAGLILINILGAPLTRMLEGVDAALLSLFFNLLYYLPFVALPVYLLARRTSGLWTAYRPYPISLFSVISIAALAFMGVFFTVDIAALWTILLQALGLDSIGSSIAIPAGAPGLMMYVFCSAVLPGVCEEFLFRGAILSSFERSGTRRAVIIAAFMFALLHGSILGLPSQFILGLIMGWLVVYCDSIYASLIYHTTHNAASVILQLIINRNATISAVSVPNMLEAVGGFSGVFQLLVELLLMGAMILFTLRMFRMSAKLRGIELVPQRSERLKKGELALLIAILAFVGVIYGLDIYSML